MYNEPVDSIRKKMPLYREALPLDQAYIKWLGKIETQMLKTDSGLYIVNFTDSLIYNVSNNNNVSAQASLDISKGKSLIHKVYVDADYKENYLIQFQNNTLTFIKFDIKTGKELSSSTLNNVPYLPSKIIVHAGKAYFIQKNLADQQPYKLVKFSLNS
jgi:hypothetical protein